MSLPEQIAAISAEANRIIISRPKPMLRLDLACGQTPAEGYEGVDLYAPGAKHKWDLQKYPWPVEDSSVEAIRCSHYIEHIPCDVVRGGSRYGQDALFAFFDECYRILCPGGELHISCPCARNNRAFQDPTHRRFIVAETFLYMNRDWRIQNKLDHYNVACHFGLNVNPIVPTELTLLHQEAQARRFNGEWNTVLDWDAKLKSMKEAPKA